MIKHWTETFLMGQTKKETIALRKKTKGDPPTCQIVHAKTPHEQEAINHLQKNLGKMNLGNLIHVPWGMKSSSIVEDVWTQSAPTKLEDTIRGRPD